jgi:hypothetical protein
LQGLFDRVRSAAHVENPARRARLVEQDVEDARALEIADDRLAALRGYVAGVIRFANQADDGGAVDRVVSLPGDQLASAA